MGCVAILGLVIAAGCGKQPTEAVWVSFAPPDGQFTVMMPSKPEDTVSKTPAGDEAHTFSIISALSNFKAMSVGYAPQPTSVQADSERLLNLARDTAVKNLEGHLNGEKPISVGSFPAREIKFSLPQGHVVVQWIVLAHNRQYSAMVITTPSKQSTPEIARFFNSFKINP